MVICDTAFTSTESVGDAGGITHTVPNADTHDFVVDATTTLSVSETAVDVTGNITVTGTVDTVDIAAEETRLANTSGTNTGDEAAASVTVQGIVELATIAEVNTGTDATRAVTPDSLEGSALQIKVDGVETSATADQTDAEIETAYNNQVAIVSQVDAEAGTATVAERWTPERVKQAIDALSGGAGQTPWVADIDADGFDLKDLSNVEFRTTTGAPAGTVQNIHADAGGINYNVPTGDLHDFQVNAVSQMTINVSTIDFQANTLTDILDITSITSLNGVAIGNYAISTDNLSVFAATTSAQLAGVISDETGTGLLVFGTSPTIVTPTIASFTNATHNHTNAAGGGQIAASTALSDFANLALVAGDVFTGVHDFGGATSLEIPNGAAPTVDAAGEIAVDTTITDHTGAIKLHDGTEEITVIGVPTAQITTTDGHVVQYDAATNQFIMAAVGAADNLGDHTATQDLDMAGFDIDDVDSIYITEKADATADVAGQGQVWVDNLTPNILKFTDDAGTDFTVANTAMKLDSFAATTSAELASTISNETGSGLLVFGTSPTIVTPTIASFTNAQHSHLNAAGGGTITEAAISDLGTYFDTAGTGLTSSGSTVNVIGTASRITANANDIDIASDYVGQASITTLGTITTGVWTGTAVASANLDTDTMHLSVAQTVDGAKTFQDNAFLIQNPAATFEYLFQAGAIAADRTVTLPVLAGNDTLVFEAHTQTLTNKTINTASNTITVAEADISDLGTAAALVADNLSVFAATTSAELAGVISDETGSGALVFATSPTLVTPALGTPASGVMTNVTGIPVGALANGTDGELITWGSDAVATTVAVGTTGQILTSNGAGAAPTFQAAGAADNLGDHTATTDLIMGTNAVTFGIDAAAPAAGTTYITALAAGIQYNAITADIHDFLVNAVSQMTISASTIDFQANTLTDILDITSITSLNGVAIGNYILTTDNTFDTAGTGLTSSGSTVNVIGTASRITSNANDIDIASDYVGQTSIVTLGTITTGTWTGTAIASANLDVDTMHLGVAQAVTADKTFNDNVNVTFGTGGDADIDYDGTDLKINPQVVGAGNADIVAGNLDVLTGTVQEAGVDISPIGIHDIWIGATAMWPTTTAPCSDLTKTELGTNDVDIQTLDFDTAADEFAQFSMPLPRNFDNSTITFEVHWTAASGSGTASWDVAALARSEGDPLDAAFTDETTVTDTLTTANDLHISPTSADMGLTGHVDGDYIHFRVRRDVSDDTLGVDAKLLGIHFHITTDAATAA